MSATTTLRGGCHCGRVRIAFGTGTNPADLHPRACDCAFCRQHGAAYLSDPHGSLCIEAKGNDALGEYRQGSGSARFLLCRTCGVVVAVVFEDDADTLGAVNSRCIDGDVAFGSPQTVSPQRLTGAEKRRRWAQLWTPGVTVTVLP